PFPQPANRSRGDGTGALRLWRRETHPHQRPCCACGDQRRRRYPRSPTSAILSRQHSPDRRLVYLQMKTKYYRVKFLASGVNARLVPEVLADHTLQVKQSNRSSEPCTREPTVSKSQPRLTFNSK